LDIVHPSFGTSSGVAAEQFWLMPSISQHQWHLQGPIP